MDESVACHHNRLQPRRSLAQRGGSLCRLLAISFVLITATVQAQFRPSPASDRDLMTREAGGLSFQMPDVNSPLGDPLVEADATFRGRKATAWREGETKYVYLEDDVIFKMGSYGFLGTRAVIRITPQQLPGRTIQHLALFIENAATLPGFDGGPVQAEAPRLLVTASTVGKLFVEADTFERASGPVANNLVSAAMERFVRREQRLSAALLQRSLDPVVTPQDVETMLARRIAIENNRQNYLEPDGRARPVYVRKDATPQEIAAALSETEKSRAATGTGQAVETPVSQAVAGAGGGMAAVKVQQGSAMGVAVLPAAGQFNFSADRVVFDQGDGTQESVLMLIGRVRAVYTDTRAQREMTLKCERMVVFLAPGLAQGLANDEVPANAVRGVYLEDNAIVSDGQFTVRAPRVFYDIASNRAILLEAVFYAWHPQLNVPLYLRAEVMRQTSATTFQAENATLTNSEFYEPHVSIRADTITIQQEPSAGEGEEPRYKFEAQDITARFGDTPFFYLPFVSTSTAETPLEYIQFGYDTDSGLIIESGWNMFALFGMKEPEGVEVIGMLDYQGEHNIGTGVDAEYNLDNMFGSFDGYFLPYDNGDDDIQGRDPVEQEHRQRGFVHWQHRQYLPRGIEMSLELAYTSDPTFLDEFYPLEADTGKEYETSIYLKKQENDWALTFLAKYNLTDYLQQSKFLEAPGYSVDKMPELAYYQIGTSLWEDRLTYFTENRASWMRLRFGTDSPRSLGFNDRWAQTLFGLPSADTEFESAAAAAGYPLGWRGRLDSRHELNAPLKFGFLNVTPFVAGRITAYDNDFNGYGNNTSDDVVRLWGQAGTRLSTEFSNVYDIENRSLDIYQLRHIIEPHAEVYWSEANLNKSELPIYDPEVEGIAVGPGTRIGMTNTLQTKRGGPGRWRSVDWLTLQTDVVIRDQEVDPQQPVARYFGYRPEYSTGGNHFYSELQWMVTDTFGINGEMIYNLEEMDQIAYWRVGATLDHTPRLRSFMSYNEIEAVNSRLLNYGFAYELTRKYSVLFSHTISFSDDDASRDIEIELIRKLPRWTLRVFINHDAIENDTTFGFLVEPQGLSLNQSNGSRNALAR